MISNFSDIYHGTADSLGRCFPVKLHRILPPHQGLSQVFNVLPAFKVLLGPATPVSFFFFLTRGRILGQCLNLGYLKRWGCIFGDIKTISLKKILFMAIPRAGGA